MKGIEDMGDDFVEIERNVGRCKSVVGMYKGAGEDVPETGKRRHKNGRRWQVL
jgi:hypothetical protein